MFSKSRKSKIRRNTGELRYKYNPTVPTTLFSVSLTPSLSDSHPTFIPRPVYILNKEFIAVYFLAYSLQQRKSANIHWLYVGFIAYCVRYGTGLLQPHPAFISKYGLEKKSTSVNQRFPLELSLWFSKYCIFAICLINDSICRKIWS